MSHLSLPRVRRVAMIALGVAIAALLVALFYANHESAQSATNLPADKVTVSAATTDVSAPGKDVTLLTGTLRNSTPADLLISTTAECSIVTNVSTTGTDDQKAEGVINMWIVIDKTQVVPVSPTANDDGKVTFCNHAYERKTTFNANDQDDTIATFDTTKQANAFNWTALNVGNGVHTIELHAELTTTATNSATADAVVGKRTMTVLPGHMATNASF
jgi:hypothetical protein